MKYARNSDMDSAISIASFIIQSLKDDTNISDWFEYYDVLERAIAKWQKPHKKTLIHEYIEDLFLDSQNYMLGEHILVGETSQMQHLLEYYNVDYSSISKIDVSELPYDECTDELEDYAYELQKLFIDNILDTIVDDAFTILLESKKFYITKKPGNPNRFLTDPAAPELFDLYAILAVFP